MENVKTTTLVTFAKSFYLLGDSLDYCYDCDYCRLNAEKCKSEHYDILPNEINHNFNKLPVAINLFYGDPLLQINNTISYLKKLESINYLGPVVIITKGDFSKFPDIPFNLDLHIAFSIFGTDSKLDGGKIERVKSNLEIIKKRKYNYKYSLEYRPICYQVNDSKECFDLVLSLARDNNLSVGYSGLQGKPESVKIWEENNIPLKPYPGYTFGHKKLISKEKTDEFEDMASMYKVPIFRKTSCLISYVHNLERDYNSHYYRKNEVGCDKCIMKEKCMKFKNNLKLDNNLDDVIPFDYEIIEKKDHVCILKKNNICNFPTEDCSHINGKLIKINDKITTSDVRVIKWLTGYTVDASFYESPYISESWIEDKKLLLRRV